MWLSMKSANVLLYWMVAKWRSIALRRWYTNLPKQTQITRLMMILRDGFASLLTLGISIGVVDPREIELDVLDHLRNEGLTANYRCSEFPKVKVQKLLIVSKMKSSSSLWFSVLKRLPFNELTDLIYGLPADSSIVRWNAEASAWRWLGSSIGI